MALLKEYITSKDFNHKEMLAGYILENGSFVYVDEYHNEEDNPYKNLGLPEFSATHLDDICVRIYKEPNAIQYKELEKIIDNYLNDYYYCKIELYNSSYSPYFYKVYAIVEGNYNPFKEDEIVGNWTGYKLVQIIKNNINKNAFNESLNEDYPTPKKLYDIKDDKAYWPEDSEDYIWWDSEAKGIDNYAKCYKIELSPEDFLNLTTKKGASNLKLGDTLGFDPLEKLDINRFNKETYQPLFLIVSFKKDPNIAYVTGHEGRHRAFALMEAGIKKIDVQMRCEEYDSSFDKYHPLNLKDFYLIGQYNKNIKINVKNAIPMSWAKHKEIRPNLKEDVNNIWKTNLFKFLKIRFQKSDTPIQRSFLLPDGTFIGTPESKAHYQIDNVIFNSFFGYVGKLYYDNYSEEEKEISRNQFNLTDSEIIDVYEHIQYMEGGKLDGSPLLSMLGCLRLNGDKENFCEIPSKEDVNDLTSIQYDHLKDWLYSFAYTKDTFEVNIAGDYINDIESYAEYNPKDPDYIISRIKKYYRTQHLLESLLLEMNRNQLIQKSKKSDNYKDTSKGRNRWERRNKSKIATRVDQYNKIDMNKLFKDDELKVGINVHGETDDYIVTIRYNGVLKEIENQIKLNNNTLEFKCILIALQRVFNSGNVFVSCNCMDWKFRQAYNATRGGYNSGTPEVRASDITNPGDTKGAGCKHVNLVLGNVDWLMKICSVINNYIHYMKDHFERKYADLIFPKLFGMPYQRAVQLNLFDTDDTLQDNPDEIKLSNKYGRDRTKFKSDVKINNMKYFGGSKKEKPDDPNQPKLDLGLTRDHIEGHR